MRINNFDQSSDSEEIFATKLAYIGAKFSTFGHDLQATAAGLTLEILEKSKKQDSQNKQTQYLEYEIMQKQVDYLDDLINKITLFSEDVIKTVEPLLFGEIQNEGLKEIINDHLNRNLEYLKNEINRS